MESARTYFAFFFLDPLCIENRFGPFDDPFNNLTVRLALDGIIN